MLVVAKDQLSVDALARAQHEETLELTDPELRREDEEPRHAEQVEKVAIAVHDHVVDDLLNVDGHPQPQHRERERADEGLYHDAPMRAHQLPEALQRQRRARDAARIHRRSEEHQHSRPLDRKLSEQQAVAPAGRRIHDADVPLRRFLEHDEMPAPVGDGVSDGRLRDLAQTLNGSLHTFRRQTQLARCADQTVDRRARRVGAGELSQARHRHPPSVKGRNRVQTRGGAVGGVALLYLPHSSEHAHDRPLPARAGLTQASTSSYNSWKRLRSATANRARKLMPLRSSPRTPLRSARCDRSSAHRTRNTGAPSPARMSPEMSVTVPMMTPHSV